MTKNDVLHLVFYIINIHQCYN